MDDLVLREKYLDLQSRLYDIKDKLNNLMCDYDSLSSTVKGAVLIEGRVVFEDDFSFILSSSNEVLEEITNVLIPIVNSKI
ncbi:MAG: hypothetical protein J6B89_02820 [Bacilli bacterium]|nr:hypothetical protein [Bacilli bacterium]